MCPLYTHVTPILQCIGPCDLFRSFRSIFVYNAIVLLLLTDIVYLSNYDYDYYHCKRPYIFKYLAYCSIMLPLSPGCTHLVYVLAIDMWMVLYLYYLSGR